MNEIEHIFIDIHNVLADFAGGISKLFDKDVTHSTNWNLWKELEVTPHEFWQKIEKEQMFWAHLKPYPWARDLVNHCLEKTKGNVTLATSPSTDPKCPAEVSVWVRWHFPALTRKLMIGPEKHLFAQPTHLLIDDSDKNCNMFKECGGQVILFPQPWNAAKNAGWDDVEANDKLGYIKACLKQTSYNK